MSSVLLLNASYEPLAVIPLKRALALVLKGRVEAACPEAIKLTGVSQLFQVPMVVRLRRYINVPQRSARWSRKAVLQRDNYTCGYCGIMAGAFQSGQRLQRSQLTIDHILPLSRGGRNSWGNTVCACPVCNQRKGNRMPHEAQMPLLWEPKTPRINYLVADGHMPAAWKIYLELKPRSL